MAEGRCVGVGRTLATRLRILARIAVPRRSLHVILDTLPRDSKWWASPGTGIAHWSFTGDAETLRDVRRAAEKLQGSLVLLAAPAEIMTAVGAWGTPPATIEVMRRLKRAFDPDGILNPGGLSFDHETLRSAQR